MSRDPKAKPRPLTIAPWPWWLERPYVIAFFYLCCMLLRLYFDFLRGDYREMLWDFFIYSGLLVGFVVVRAIIEWRRDRPEVEELPAPICPACGYDLRATLMRCPECGADTPFKGWLDAHPLDRVVYEKGLEPRVRGMQRDAAGARDDGHAR